MVDYQEQQNMLKTIEATVIEIHTAVNDMLSAKSQLKQYNQLLEDNTKAEAL